jgi:DNA-binding CsgD family transcriptional regulator
MSVVRLSPRQLECVVLLAAGCTSAMVAVRLKLSVHTVNQYISEACLRLEVRNRTQLVAEAIRLGLV